MHIHICCSMIITMCMGLSQYLGDMERMQTTSFYWGNKTYESEVQGFFITISGSLVQYYRGFRFVSGIHCAEGLNPKLFAVP